MKPNSLTQDRQDLILRFLALSATLILLFSLNKAHNVIAQSDPKWSENTYRSLPLFTVPPDTVGQDFAGSPASSPEILFFDTFNSENGGSGALNYVGLTNWSVSNGTVDLIGNGFYDFLPGNGLYVDLDGTSYDAGKLETKTGIPLSLGNYVLQFDLAGSQRGDTNYVTVKFGKVYSETFTLVSDFPFTTITRNILIQNPTDAKLSFEQPDSYDNFGALLDNVRLSKSTNFAISGRVIDTSNNSLSGVTTSTDSGINITTDARGIYTFTGLTTGTYTIIPSMSGYVFSPGSRVISVPPDATGVDFVGTPLTRTYTVSGRLTDSIGAGIPEVRIVSDRGHRTTSDGSGHYTFNWLPVGTHTFTPVKDRYTFTPTSQTITVPLKNTTIDFVGTADPPPSPSSPTKEPVLLVHGWQGSGAGFDCDPETPNAETEVLRFWESPTSSRETVKYWGKMPEWLLDDGYDVWVASFSTGDNGTPPLIKMGKCIRNQINHVYNKLQEEGNRDKIIMIGHSTGGPVSRACLKHPDCRDKVQALITLGSPHAGLPAGTLADWANIFSLNLSDCAKHPAGCNMSGLGMKYFNRDHPNLAGVHYFFLGGDGKPLMLSSVPGGLTLGGHDGLVGKNSAVGWFFFPPRPYFNPSGWADKSPPAQYWTDEVHSRLYSSDGTKYNDYYNYRARGNNIGEQSYAYQCLKAWMENGYSESFIPTQKCEQASQLHPFEVSTQSSLPHLSAQTHTSSGHLASGQTVTHSLQIDSRGATLFYLSWDSGTLGLTLTRPNGQMITPNYAVSHPAEMDYEYNAGGPDLSPYAAYLITDTITGTWQVDVTAHETDAGGADYQVFAMLESNRTLAAGMDDYIYEVGDTATITASLETGGIGLAGASVTAILERADGISNTVMLVDQGSGDYQASYTIPDAPGYLPVVIKTSGTDNGTAFTRQAKLLAAVAPHNAQATGVYSGQPVDIDDDSLHEIFEVDVEIDVTEAGAYLVSADLEANGQYVAQTTVYTVLATGTQTVTLQFEGGEIEASQQNGPYTVTRFSIVPAGLGIAAQRADDVWTTPAYQHSEFESSTAGNLDVYLPIIIK